MVNAVSRSGICFSRMTAVLRSTFVIALILCVLAQQANTQDGATPRLNAKIAVDAINEFKRALDERWSYRYANHADFDAAIAKLLKKVEAERGITQDDLGIELQKIIALGTDGHAGVSGFSLPAGGRLPFLIEPLGQRFVAFDSQRKAFLAVLSLVVLINV